MDNEDENDLGRVNAAQVADMDVLGAVADAARRYRDVYRDSATNLPGSKTPTEVSFARRVLFAELDALDLRLNRSLNRQEGAHD